MSLRIKALNVLDPRRPDRLLRRMRIRQGQDCLQLDNAICNGTPGLVEHLRALAQQEEEDADFWEYSDHEIGQQVREGLEHVVWQYRRNARRLRDTADALERDHAAGPWIDLRQPFVHLGEARPTLEEVH